MTWLGGYGRLDGVQLHQDRLMELSALQSAVALFSLRVTTPLVGAERLLGGRDEMTLCVSGRRSIRREAVYQTPPEDVL